MAETVRATLYASDSKLVEVESSDFSSKTNAERLHGQEGVLGGSSGNPEVDIRANIIPTKTPSGAYDKLVDAHLSQKEIVAIYKFGLRTMKVPVKVTELSANSDNRTGVVKGTLNLMSTGNPEPI